MLPSGARCRGAHLLRTDEGVHPLLQHRQRNRAKREDRIVEAAFVELWSKGRLRLLSKAKDRDLAELVRQRLAGPADVAVDLGLDFVLGERGVTREIVDRLLPRPPVL